MRIKFKVISNQNVRHCSTNFWNKNYSCNLSATTPTTKKITYQSKFKLLEFSEFTFIGS